MEDVRVTVIEDSDGLAVLTHILIIVDGRLAARDAVFVDDLNKTDNTFFSERASTF